MRITKATFAGSSQKLDQRPKLRAPEFAFIGRSNVGKSSLINMLCEQKKLAHTSATPGKTRLVNHFYINDRWYLVDLPGYGYAKVPFSERDRWSDLMEGYFRGGRDIRMAFQLIDMRHKPTEFDMVMLDFLYRMEIPYTIVLTKSDKLNKSEYAERLSKIREELGEFGEVKIIPFSAQNGQGVNELREIIEEVI